MAFFTYNSEVENQQTRSPVLALILSVKSGGKINLSVLASSSLKGKSFNK